MPYFEDHYVLQMQYIFEYFYFNTVLIGCQCLYQAHQKTVHPLRIKLAIFCCCPFKTYKYTLYVGYCLFTYVIYTVVYQDGSICCGHNYVLLVSLSWTQFVYRQFPLFQCSANRQFPWTLIQSSQLFSILSYYTALWNT